MYGQPKSILCAQANLLHIVSKITYVSSRNGQPTSDPYSTTGQMNQALCMSKNCSSTKFPGTLANGNCILLNSGDEIILFIWLLNFNFHAYITYVD